MPVRLEPFEDGLPVMEHGGGRLKRQPLAGADLQRMPAVPRISARRSHVIGEVATEAGRGEDGCAILLRRHLGPTVEDELRTGSWTRSTPPTVRIRRRRWRSATGCTPMIFVGSRPRQGADVDERARAS